MYEHTQRNFLILAIMFVAGVVPQAVILALRVDTMPAGARLTIIVALLVILAAGITFTSLTIRVSDRKLSWHFGAGLLGRSIPLDEIAAAEATTTSWWDGIGIHYTARGWLYNISGKYAVVITEKDGKRLLLGTDEANALVAAIREHQRLPHAG